MKIQHKMECDGSGSSFYCLLAGWAVFAGWLFVRDHKINVFASKPVMNYIYVHKVHSSRRLILLLLTTTRIGCLLSCGRGRFHVHSLTVVAVVVIVFFFFLFFSDRLATHASVINLR